MYLVKPVLHQTTRANNYNLLKIQDQKFKKNLNIKLQFWKKKHEINQKKRIGLNAMKYDSNIENFPFFSRKISKIVTF